MARLHGAGLRRLRLDPRHPRHGGLPVRGLVFIRGAIGELRVRQPGMMTLIALAIVVAFVTSWAGSLALFEAEIWWGQATLITIMLLGHWLEMRSIAQARGRSRPWPSFCPIRPSA